MRALEGTTESLCGTGRVAAEDEGYKVGTSHQRLLYWQRARRTWDGIQMRGCAHASSPGRRGPPSVWPKIDRRRLRHSPDWLPV
eukprot:scaffold86939_cov32-Tisochrysis_lutea.AAC.4